MGILLLNSLYCGRCDSFIGWGLYKAIVFDYIKKWIRILLFSICNLAYCYDPFQFVSL